MLQIRITVSGMSMRMNSTMLRASTLPADGRAVSSVAKVRLACLRGRAIAGDPNQSRALLSCSSCSLDGGVDSTPMSMRLGRL